ncbi:hypothetical protein CEUSTIGMA_g11205.t1 [Chlamydomonas eustigma]|uniref:tRNA (guanine(9)-N(1))-methyltransferase n=1 Tax=Chlamydomonas eustigma TaxID=1157962 RepID=A0A250XLX0_9CHLO|nr:hypothetical protein CEUSTIGMA_g11205.t1 [Chlamydomonas eustigma]|eukprot:GAX83780.1 hypothetical protein CEUSTIGMA_g11205.t1 [Chlamydomonas eustigma]
MQEVKEQRKAKEKEARKEKQELRRKEQMHKLQLLTEEERENLKKQAQALLQERRGQHASKRSKLEHAQQHGPDLVIDLDFEGLMSGSELKHLCQQLCYSYSANGRVANPCHLHLVGFKGDVKEAAERQINGLPNWVVTKTQDSLLHHFSQRKDKLVYLTADSETELDVLDASSIYVIGGLVDHNRYKGLCQQRAQEAGISTARLPIKKFVELESRAVLTVNHVVQIMVEMFNRQDWKAVLDDVLPPRKRAGYHAAKTESKMRRKGGEDGCRVDVISDPTPCRTIREDVAEVEEVDAAEVIDEAAKVVDNK